MALEGFYLVPDLFHPLCFLSTVRWTASATPTTMMFCLTTGPETQSKVTMHWSLWTHEPKYFFSLFKFFSQVFQSQMRKSN
jgi:hypothetical protein